MSNRQEDNHKSDSDDEKTNDEALSIKSVNDDVKPLNDSTMTESMEKLDLPKLKPTTLERRKPPVATPRHLTNTNSTATNQQGKFFSFFFYFNVIIM